MMVSSSEGGRNKQEGGEWNSRLVINHERTVGVLEGGVSGEDRVVRLHDGVGDLMNKRVESTRSASIFDSFSSLRTRKVRNSPWERGKPRTRAWTSYRSR